MVELSGERKRNITNPVFLNAMRYTSDAEMEELKIDYRLDQPVHRPI